MSYNNDNQFNTTQIEPDYDSYVSCNDELFYASSATASLTPQANDIWSNPTGEPVPVAQDFIGNLSLDDAYAYSSFVMPGSPANQFLAPGMHDQQPDVWMTASGVLVQPQMQRDFNRALSTSAVPRPRTHAIRRRPLSTSAIPQAIPHISTPRDHTVCWVNCVDDSDRMIFECRVDECGGTYARWADFKRHYDGGHAFQRPEYWCPEPLCERSQEFGGSPFPRKDKMMDHAQNVHGLTPSRVNSKRKRNTCGGPGQA